MMTQTKKTQNPKKSDKLPWPFPVRNGERTEASRALLEESTKHTHTKDTLEDYPEATF